MAKDNDKAPIIIIKKIKKIDGGHHGGAWKVAYADFVTAMMAFFLLLWLLNTVTDEQKEVISSYFAPTDPRIADSTSGAGGVMGGTTMATEGAMTDERSTITDPNEPTEGVGKNDAEEEVKQIEEMDKKDELAFQQAEEKIRQAIESVPELKELAQNLLIDMTPEGLRIQMVDQEGKPMFELGSAKPLPQAVTLLQLIAKVVQDLPNKISIRGHTDATPYGKDAAYTNWELSSDRANASRRVMLASSLDVARLENVQGKADREPLIPEDPTNAKNRRISIILLKQSLAAAAASKEKRKANQKVNEPQKPEPKKREEGVIYFP